LLTAGLVFVRDMFAVMGWSISNLVKITISVGKNRKVNVSLRYWTVSGGYTTRLFAQFRLSSWAYEESIHQYKMAQSFNNDKQISDRGFFKHVYLNSGIKKI